MQKKNIKVGSKTGHNKIKKGKGKKENEMKHSNKIIRQKKNQTNKRTYKQVQILAYAHVLENMPLLNCKTHF